MTQPSLLHDETRLEINQDLLRRLPLPLARLYLQAHCAKDARGEHDAALCLWEAAIKLMGAAAIASFVAQKESDSAAAEVSQCLVRPSLGHWWHRIAGTLVPKLAKEGEAGFGELHAAVWGKAHDDLPLAAGLYVKLLECLEGKSSSRSTVPLDDLFARIVAYRNDRAHGGLADHAFYRSMGRALLLGAADVLERVDVLAGRKLVFVEQVQKAASGNWRVLRHLLYGPSRQDLPPLEVAEERTDLLPKPERLYLAGGESLANGGADLRPLDPLVVCDAECIDLYFWNGLKGKGKGAAEYLNYECGPMDVELALAHRDFLAALTGAAASEEELRAWSAKADAEPSAATNASTAIPDFELQSCLGTGQQGIVYRAVQTSLGRQVALKKLFRVGDAKAKRRFQREIKALGRVDHPHVVKAYTSGSHGESWYYAMELVEGPPLDLVCRELAGRNASTVDNAAWLTAVSSALGAARRNEHALEEETPEAAESLDAGGNESPAIGIPPGLQERDDLYTRLVVEIMRQAALGAHALHEKGIVHRDIKPANILLTADGSRAVLTDLGLAQMMDETAGTRVHTQGFVGTWRYASPEQVRTVSHLDGRSDVYSLGGTLWELLTLRPLFSETESTPLDELVEKILHDEPAPASRYNRRVDRGLDSIVRKCLEKKPSDRYQSAAELAEDLERWQQGEPVRAASRGVVGTLLRPLRKHGKAAVAALVLLAIGVAAAWRYYEAHQHFVNFEQETIEHYAYFTTRWGALEGVSPFSLEEAQRQPFTFRVVRSGKLGPVLRLEAVNSAGYYEDSGMRLWIEGLAVEGALPPAQRTVRMDFVYDALGRVRDHIGHNRFGDEVFRVVYSYGEDDGKQPGIAYGRYARPGGFDYAISAAATVFRSERTPDGFDRRITYYDSHNHPVMNRDGAHAIEIESNDLGLPERITFLDAKGDPVHNVSGYASVRREYGSGFGHFATTESYFDEHGGPIEGVSRVVQEWLDEDTQVMRRIDLRKTSRSNPPAPSHDASSLGSLQPEPASAVDPGWIVAYFDYDAAGRRTEIRLCKDDQTLSDQVSVSRETFSYDEQGRLRGLAFFDHEGNPAPASRDAISFIAVATSLEDLSYTRAEFEYEGERRVRCHFFDKSGLRWIEDFGPRGENVKVAILAGGESPAEERGREFDEAGRLIAEEVIREGEFLLRRRFQYDDYGNVTRVSHEDRDGTPARIMPVLLGATILPRPACAAVETTYDAAGQPLAQTLIDCDPAAGYYSRRETLIRRDSAFEASQEEFFDKDGVVVRTDAGYPAGFSRALRSYDESRGGSIVITYEGYDGKKGYYAVVASLNEREESLTMTYRDENGGLARNENGYSSETVYTDEEGQLVRRLQRGFDPDNNYGFNAIDNRIANQVIVERRYLSENEFGELAPNDYGAAQRIDTFDAKGRQLSIRVESIDGALVDPPGGFAQVKVVRNASGRATQVLHLDSREQPVPAEVIVIEVTAGGQGESLGLTVGDVLVSYGGQPVRSTTHFIEGRQTEAEGSDPRELIVRHGETLLPMNLTPGMLNIRLEDRAATSPAPRPTQ